MTKVWSMDATSSPIRSIGLRFGKASGRGRKRKMKKMMDNH